MEVKARLDEKRDFTIFFFFYSDFKFNETVMTEEEISNMHNRRKQE